MKKSNSNDKHLTPEEKWSLKSDYQKLEATNKSYTILRKAAKRQLDILKTQKFDDSFVKYPRHHFIFETIKTFWRDADLTIYLSKNEHNLYVVYPIRTMMEKTLRMRHFLKKKTLEQDDCANKDFLLFSKKLYDFDKIIGIDTSIAEHSYNMQNAVTNNKYPTADKVSKGKLKPFPRYVDISTEKEYKYYEWLSALPHGEIAHSISRIPNEYRLLMMHRNLSCYEILKLTDTYLENKINPETKKAIKEAVSLIYSN